MKKIIILCTTLSFLFIPVNLLADDASLNKINSLENKMSKLTNKIDEIVTNSRKAKMISEKYKQIAIQHLNVVSDFTKQKSLCQNLEDTYKEKQARKSLDRRVIKKQGKNVVDCYETLEILIYEFEGMSRDFNELKDSISTLRDMSKTDIASIRSLEKQAKTIESLIAMEKSKAALSRNEVEKAIDNF